MAKKGQRRSKRSQTVISLEGFFTDSVVVCAGDCSETTHIKEFCDRASRVIAADAGIFYCHRAGVKPDVWVGDGDSTEKMLKAMTSASSAVAETYERVILEQFLQSVEQEKHPRDKDMSDTELAVKAAFDRGAKRVALLCSQGKRLDHALANIQLLLKHPFKTFSRGRDYILFSLERGARVRLDGSKGDILSLFSWTRGCTVNARSGLRWPLKNESIKVGTRGLSNEMTGQPVDLTVRTGRLLVFMSPSEHIPEILKTED
ncbi:MAG: thiamine diphosphokinase [Planctomycetota bacterium]|nr:thiamine diphosphokinase [Planctomycetota bacterium]